MYSVGSHLSSPLLLRVILSPVRLPTLTMDMHSIWGYALVCYDFLIFTFHSSNTVIDFLKVFPAGASSSVNGYVGLFFGLTQGDNDSSITWPFSNRFIQLTILDQSGDPLYALSKHGSFLTDSSTTFEQPVR